MKWRVPDPEVDQRGLRERLMSDFETKMHQIRAGAPPDPTGGAYSASRDSLAGGEGAD